MADLLYTSSPAAGRRGSLNGHKPIRTHSARNLQASWPGGRTEPTPITVCSLKILVKLCIIWYSQSITTEIAITTERIDDFPLLFEIKICLGLPGVLDHRLSRQCLPPGLSWGWIASLWLALSKAIIANNRCEPGCVKPKRKSNGSANGKYGNWISWMIGWLKIEKSQNHFSNCKVISSD